MLVCNNIKKSVTILYETNEIDPLTYKTKVKKIKIDGVFCDFTNGIDKNQGLNTSFSEVFLCVPINEYKAFFKKNNLFYIDEDSDTVYKITKVNCKEYGYNPHLEIYGR